MKQTDFDRLKAICEKEGFELHVTDRNEDQASIIIQKKDIWEGVEFVKSVWSSKIYPINQVDIKLRSDVKKDDWEPSTESAYIEQLKAECFKRFGEIKENQKFIAATDGEYEFHKSKNVEWDYFKNVDQLFHYNVELYAKGKWATRVKERVKVEWENWSWAKDLNHINLEFSIKYADWSDVKNKDDVGDSLASKLEEYLNKE